MYTLSMDENNTINPEMASLAADVCNLWQEHLANVANDPAAKAELARMLEPQRQAMTKLFADYTAMMQHNPYARPAHNTAHEGTKPTSASQSDAAPPRSAPSPATSDDGALRVAQLAHRVAVLEERIGKLESQLAARANKRSGRGAKRPSEEPGDGESDI